MAVSQKNRVWLDVITGKIDYADKMIPLSVLICTDSIYFCERNPQRFKRIHHLEGAHNYRLVFPLTAHIEGDFFVLNHFIEDVEKRLKAGVDTIKVKAQLTEDQIIYRVNFFLYAEGHDLVDLWIPKSNMIFKKINSNYSHQYHQYKIYGNR